MLRLAVIGTFYRRHESTLPLMKRLMVDSTRKPDEIWLMCEDWDDRKAIDDAYKVLYESEMIDDWPVNTHVVMLPTPIGREGYTVIPYSNKINYALERTKADVVCYLDNGSMPTDDKYEVMLKALEEHPEWGAVFCDQKRTGYHNEVVSVGEVVKDAFCLLNYTQVMHRKTDDRWTLDMAHANPDLADGYFWRSLHESLGDFYPVGNGVLDHHHIPSPAAEGIVDKTR